MTDPHAHSTLVFSFERAVRSSASLFLRQGEMETNRERVALGRLYEGNCTHMWWSTLEAVIYWQENRPYMIDDDPEDAFTDACTREERDYLLVRS